MKAAYPLAMGLLLLAIPCMAQITMQVSTDRQHYVTYEEILMKVVIRNNSGNVIDFSSDSNDGADGAQRGYVRIEVGDKHGRHLSPRSEHTEVNGVRAPRPVSFNVAGNLSLAPGGSKSVVFTVNDYFDMTEEGYYTLTAVVGHDRFRDEFVSQPIRIKVNDGVVKWERDIGVPSRSSTAPIDYRQATILTFQADASQIYILRIQDDRFVYAVKRLAPRVRGVEPQIEVDARSCIHFFVQTQPRLFSHWVFDCNGAEKQEAHYVVEEYLPIPRLIRDPDIGRVMVVGGRRAQEGVDFNEVTLPVMEAREVDPNAPSANATTPPKSDAGKAGS